MPDIAMCLNHDCKLKESCKRYNSTPSDYQYYSDFKPDDKGNCDNYWEQNKLLFSINNYRIKQ